MNPENYINKINRESNFNKKIKLRLEFKEKLPEEFEDLSDVQIFEVKV